MTTEKRHFEVILAGTGGQGLILSGILLAEAAILGHKKGSFTGAISDRPGAFEQLRIEGDPALPVVALAGQVERVAQGRRGVAAFDDGGQIEHG